MWWIWILACRGEPEPEETHDSAPAVDSVGSEDSVPAAHDSDCEIVTLYQDADGDGHGTAAVTMAGCEGEEGWSTVGDDCDDTNPEVWDECGSLEEECSELGQGSYADDADTGGSTQLSTYWYCPMPMGWQDGRQHCYDTFEGADLVALDREGERDQVERLSAALDPERSYWVGLSQPDTAPTVEFGWNWVDGLGYPDALSVLDFAVLPQLLLVCPVLP